MKSKNSKGFTLIELLVVIAIVSLLSSVVLASLNNARLKGRDSAILNQMMQLRNIFELEYARIGNYTALQQSWVTSLADCDVDYPPGSTNPNVVQVNKICRSMYPTSADDPVGLAGYRFHFGNQINLATKYSVMVYLPGKKLWQCVGGSGVSTVAWTAWDVGDIPAPPPGCYGNP